MTAILWFSIGALIVAYPFLIYPALLWILSICLHRPPRKEEITPFVSFIVAASNEEQVVGRKLDSILRSDYPGEFEVIIASDGSTDRTNQIVSAYSDARVHLLALPRREGKPSAINAALMHARGEIVVFTDARQLLETSAVRNMVSNFSDPRVGCVSGVLMIGHLETGVGHGGEELKWGLENWIRNREGNFRSVVGALGAFYAARRELIVNLPPDILLDDCFIPLHVVKRGKRTVFESEARAWDDVKPAPALEFRRKVRTLAGNYQLIGKAPWLLSPDNPILFEFIGHKLARLLMPIGFLLMLVAPQFSHSRILQSLSWLQMLAYLAGILGILVDKLPRASSILDICRTVVVINAAALAAAWCFIRGNFDVWQSRTTHQFTAEAIGGDSGKTCGQ